MALLDFLNSPQAAMAAGLLSPTQSGGFGPALSQGIVQSLAAQRAQLLAQTQRQALEQELIRFQQQQQMQQAQQAALRNITQQQPVQLANQGGGFTANNINQNFGRTQSLSLIHI